jgi:hypothetical protein
LLASSLQLFSFLLLFSLWPYNHPFSIRGLEEIAMMQFSTLLIKPCMTFQEFMQVFFSFPTGNCKTRFVEHSEMMQSLPQ